MNLYINQSSQYGAKVSLYNLVANYYHLIKEIITNKLKKEIRTWINTNTINLGMLIIGLTALTVFLLKNLIFLKILAATTGMES
tara:strand:+ start:1399 stop:1650 length:252 start_codon:yes stop_codon:yes gene_type:complete